jgi:hypothetical protein
VWYHFSSPPPERKKNLFPRAKHIHTYISQNSSGRRKGKDGDGNTEKERHRERAEEERKRPHSSSSEGDDDAAPEEKEGSIPLPSNGPPAHGLEAGGGGVFNPILVVFPHPPGPSARSFLVQAPATASVWASSRVQTHQ